MERISGLNILVMSILIILALLAIIKGLKIIFTILLIIAIIYGAKTAATYIETNYYETDVTIEQIQEDAKNLPSKDELINENSLPKLRIRYYDTGDPNAGLEESVRINGR